MRGTVQDTFDAVSLVWLCKTAGSRILEALALLPSPGGLMGGRKRGGRREGGKVLCAVVPSLILY